MIRLETQHIIGYQSIVVVQIPVRFREFIGVLIHVEIARTSVLEHETGNVSILD